MNKKNIVKILMEEYIPIEKYEEDIKRKINLYFGNPICNGETYDMEFNPSPRKISQEIYHKQGSTILLEEEELNSMQNQIRATILIAYDLDSPNKLIETLKNLSPYLKLEENIGLKNKKDSSQWFG